MSNLLAKSVNIQLAGRDSDQPVPGWLRVSDVAAIRTYCRIGSFIDRALRIDDVGVMAIEFDFVDRHGKAWRHSNLLSAIRLWPGSGCRVVIAKREKPRGWSVGFMVSQTDTSQLGLRTVDGEIIEGYGGRSTFSVVLYDNRPGSVMAHGVIGSLHRFADRGYLDFEYQVDIASLLWRKAPILSRGKVECEAADHIDLQPLDAPPPGLERSDIEIVEDPGRSAASAPPPLRLSLDRGPVREPVEILEEAMVPRSSLRKRIAIPIPERRVVAYGASPAVELKPGALHGLLRLDRYVGPFEERPEHLFTAALDFVDESGKAWRYVGLSSAARLWPPENMAVRIASRSGPGDLAIAVALDGRDDALVRLDTGETLTLRMKYFSFDIAATPGDDPAAIRVHALLCPVEHPRSDRTILGVEYEVPVADLLWRRASAVLEEDADAESGNSIDLRPLDSIDPSLPRSSIRVI